MRKDRAKQLEAALRFELQWLGLPFTGAHAKLPEAERALLVEVYSGRRLQAQRRAAELATGRASKEAQQDEEEFHRLDPELQGTMGTLANGTGGGRRNIRSSRGLS